MMVQRHAPSSSTASGERGTSVSSAADGARDRSDALLRMSGVEYTYPSGVKAVGGCEIEIGAGEIVALVGPSGCGKTTILNLIAELVSPDTGSIVWDEGYFAQPDRSDGTRLGMVFQRDTVFPWRTVERNVVFGMEHLSMSQSERRERTDQLLELANLQEFRKVYPLSLSGGMRRRVALLMSLAVRPGSLASRRAVRRLGRAHQSRAPGLSSQVYLQKFDVGRSSYPRSRRGNISCRPGYRDV